MTELDAATGALVKVIAGSRYRFNQPFAISSDGTDVWVANLLNQSVTGFPIAAAKFDRPSDTATSTRASTA